MTILLRRAMVAVMSVAWIVAAAPSVSGQTFGIDFRNTLMPASGGMAGTSVAAPQDFLSAINGNAAALTQFEGTHFTIGGAFAGPTVRLSQADPIPLLGVDPFSQKSSTPGAVVPALGVSQSLDGLPLPTTVGVAVLGAATRVDISSYWIGLGLTWHYDRTEPRRGS